MGFVIGSRFVKFVRCTSVLPNSFAAKAAKRGTFFFSIPAY